MRSSHSSTGSGFTIQQQKHGGITGATCSVFLGIVGDQNFREVRPQDVDRYVSHQIDEGFKPSTVNRRLAAIVSFYLLAAGMSITSIQELMDGSPFR